MSEYGLLEVETPASSEVRPDLVVRLSEANYLIGLLGGILEAAHKQGLLINFAEDAVDRALARVEDFYR